MIVNHFKRQKYKKKIRRKKKRIFNAILRDTNDKENDSSPQSIKEINLEEIKWQEREREAQDLWKIKQNSIKVIEEKKLKEIKDYNKDSNNTVESSFYCGLEKFILNIFIETITIVVEVQRVKLPFDLPYRNPFEPEFLDQSKREICHFFRKTGVCRFDLRCSRLHEMPLVSDTIVFMNMFTSNYMEMLMAGGDPDSTLECDETELINEYEEFYTDIETEFSSFGRVLSIRTCRNAMRHLRGNVYVQYRNINDAVYAYSQLNGRYYAGNRVVARFVTIDSWRESICGLYFRGKCPKGGICNFMHVLLNKGESLRDLHHFLRQPCTQTISRRSSKCRHRSRTCSSINSASTPEVRPSHSVGKVPSSSRLRRHKSSSRKKQKSHRSDRRSRSSSRDHSRHRRKRTRHKN